MTSLYRIFETFFWERRIRDVKRGKNVCIGPGIFSACEKIVIGDNVHVGRGAFWNALGGITLENDVIIGPNSTIWTLNHNINSSKYLPYDEYEVLKPVYIEKNVWIGINVNISPGARIGEGAVVAMGSVVVGEVPSLSIVGGNPARIIGRRDEILYRKIVDSSTDYSYLAAKANGTIVKKTFDK